MRGTLAAAFAVILAGLDFADFLRARFEETNLNFASLGSRLTCSYFSFTYYTQHCNALH
jgi:hypothetical protein